MELLTADHSLEYVFPIFFNNDILYNNFIMYLRCNDTNINILFFYNLTIPGRVYKLYAYYYFEQHVVLNLNTIHKKINREFTINWHWAYESIDRIITGSTIGRINENEYQHFKNSSSLAPAATGIPSLSF